MNIPFFLLASLLAAKQPDPCAPPPEPKQCCSVLASARPCVQDDKLLRHQWDCYTELSFLYWDCVEKGLEYAIKNVSPQQNSHLTVYKPGFSFQPAFRVMVGGHLPHDHWKLDLTYSFYLQHRYNATDHYFVPSNTASYGAGIIPVWTSPGAFAGGNTYARWLYASASWKIHAHFGDLLLRHDLRTSQTVAFQPAFGLKFADFIQRYDVTYSPGGTTFSAGVAETLTSSTIKMKNHSVNVGPEAALGTRWILNRNWNLFGTLSGAVLASHFQVGRNEFDVGATTVNVISSYRFNENLWTFRPQAGLVLGFQWNDCVCRPCSVLHFGFSASYEAQVWWKQNMFLRHIDAPIAQSNILAPTQGDLYFQGLNINFLFDF